jgi:quercetin dioxygenase-like cupin family protein
MERYDDLLAFATWWTNTKKLAPPVENNATSDSSYTGAVLYRDGQYQVELFTIKPHTKSTPHLHPNVDSYEIFVSGEIDFVINGQEYHCIEGVTVPGLTRIYPNYWHTGTTSEKGGSFLSIQKWLNGVEPTSVTLDWADEAGNKQVAWTKD